MLALPAPEHIVLHRALSTPLVLPLERRPCNRKNRGILKPVWKCRHSSTTRARGESDLVIVTRIPFGERFRHLRQQAPPRFGQLSEINVSQNRPLRLFVTNRTNHGTQRDSAGNQGPFVEPSFVNDELARHLQYQHSWL